MTSEGLGEMFAGDSADTRAGKFLLAPMGAEQSVPRARTRERGPPSALAEIFLHISFSWVQISLHVEFHPPGLPRSGRFMVGDKTRQQNKKNSMKLMASLASSSG